MQGTGNALIADSIDEQTLNKIGNQIQAIGNSTVIVGLIIHFDHDTTNKVLNIQGNLLQALGSTLALPELFHETKSYSTLVSINGTLLQTIGNALQAIAGGIELNTGDEDNLDFVGSWIQAIGSVLQVLVATKSSQTTSAPK
ncbi:DUF6944 family repetitive protein [Halalkalibacter hemicellulosilyticus]|uniref:Uncharacterized protein n=1 Tax=Halalkalibacter hemicellulosilyticusJCM 9152 TaxID=1236971 RepID=W4QIC4_9BACI|nr:hypothetical protein [Halalkalibacter hemicellulosilyticus]GAE31647.1 hypothetical protein JCM9152_3127 [Halalkalibacter hemicellulosilyticusJCM 9152]